MVKLVTLQHGLAGTQGDLTPLQVHFLEIVHDEIAAASPPVQQDTESKIGPAEDQGINELRAEYRRRVQK